jgi:hypothetical protein
MTDHDAIERIRSILREHGIPRNTGKHRDYEWGKELIRELGLNDRQYFLAVNVIAGWVGV